MTDQYQYWKAALAGDKPKMFTDDPQPGFYRCGIYEKQPNKARKRIGWKPVAIFNAGSILAAVTNGSAETDRDKINELWSYVAGNPISEETYRAVAERGEPWPDSHETVPSIPVANSSASFPTPEGATGASPQNVISDQIDECTTQIIKYSKIESDEQSAKARSLQNRFLDLRGEAAKHYESANRPLLKQQKKLRETWFPLQDLADAGSTALRTSMGRWEDQKREAAKLAAETAERAAREHAEATRKAAEANQPAPPPPEPAKSNVPAPSTQIRGGTGRAGNVGTKKVVTAIDVDAVFKQFRDDPRMVEFLTDMAQRAVKAGLAVLGATVEEKADVR